MRALGRTTEAAGRTTALQQGAALLAAVVLCTDLAEIMPLVRASGTAAEAGGRTVGLDDGGALAALVVLQTPAGGQYATKAAKNYKDEK